MSEQASKLELLGQLTAMDNVLRGLDLQMEAIARKAPWAEDSDPHVDGDGAFRLGWGLMRNISQVTETYSQVLLTCRPYAAPAWCEALERTVIDLRHFEALPAAELIARMRSLLEDVRMLALTICVELRDGAMDGLGSGDYLSDDDFSALLGGSNQP